MPPIEPPPPDDAQREAARAATRWYLDSYYGTPEDVGLARMFCDPARVGAFAVDREALAAGEGEALFKLFVSMVMFQRRSDVQIMRVLRGISPSDAAELSSASALLSRAREGGCPSCVDLDALLTRCDLRKDPETRRGTCDSHPARPCHLKRHTELLMRYGHFGKVPTAAALMLSAHGVSDLPALRALILATHASPAARAEALAIALSRAWRVSDKIAAMFLSALTNADLCGELAPWAEGVDASYFVVIDSNVDLFLSAVGYSGPMTYRARRAFLQALAREIKLDELRPGLSPYNPRLVQQALYMFMSESNRRESPRDCSHTAPLSCLACPAALTRICARGALLR